MKRALVCLAVALSGGAAFAQQPQVTAVKGSLGCQDLMVTNSSNRDYYITATIHYDGELFGRPKTALEQTSGKSPARSTVIIPAHTIGIECDKHYTYKFQSWVEDLTAREEAINASREATIRGILEIEEANKRKAEAYEKQRQAEAEARARKAAELQATRDAEKQRMADLQKVSEANRLEAVRRTIAAGEPRCRQLVSPGTTAEEVSRSHQTCLRNIQEHDRSSPGYKIGSVDSQCNPPTIIFAAGETGPMADEARQKAQQLVDECRRTRAAVTPAYTGPSPAMLEAERLRTQQLDAARQLALQQEEAQRQFAAQQAAQQAALEAQRQAQIRAEAEQSIAQTTADMRQSNANFAQQSQSVRDSNAELEAWLNGN